MPIKRCPADIAFSLCVRLRAGNICEHCGSSGSTECAHIYGRAQKSVRWCAMNAISLCHYCHRQFTANPLDFTSWVESKFGEGYVEILKEKRRQKMKTNKALRSEIAAHYRSEYRRMESTGCRELVSYN
jgi:hypothetical protein